MDDGTPQPAVSIVTAHKQIEALSADPLLSFYRWQFRPGKRPSRFCLIEPIDQQGVVGTSATKLVAIRIFSYIFESSRIDEQCTSLTVQTHRQGVGMPVPGSHGALRSSINHQLLFRFAVRGHI